MFKCSKALYVIKMFSHIARVDKKKSKDEKIHIRDLLVFCKLKAQQSICFLFSQFYMIIMLEKNV